MQPPASAQLALRGAVHDDDRVVAVAGAARDGSWLGRGRHGSKVERCAHALNMRAHKAQHALRETKLRLVACKKKLILLLPCGQASSGQLWRKVTAKAMLDIGFASQWRSQELAAVHAVSKTWVRALRLYVVSMCLACQNLVLGSIIMMACRDAPFFLMTRLAWDETGEKVTVGVDTT